MPIRSGDIIAFSGSDRVSNFIKAVTFGPIHHVGIVLEMHGDLLLFESIGTLGGRPPCLDAQKVVTGVQMHRLQDVLDFVQGQKVYHLPIRRALYPEESERLMYWLYSKLGTPYNLAGAERSAGLVFRLLSSVMEPENLSSLFCSQMVAAALLDIGVFSTYNVDKFNPNALCRALYWAGKYGDRKRIK